MRFVHAADIHLDSPLRNLAQYEGAPVEALRSAGRDAFERLVDMCIEKEASFLVLAGDLYDHDTPNMQVAVFLRNQLAKLGKRGIRVVIKKGNHDADNRITSALSLPDNTTVFRDSRPQTVRFDDLPIPVALHGQSFKAGPCRENLAANYPAPVPGCLNIGVLHTSLGGYGEHAEYAPCSLSDLTTRGYAYWALGHVHKGEILARDPWVVYPGNIQGRHAKETGPKGCVLVETDGERVTNAQPVALDGLRWHRIETDLENAESDPEMIERIRAGLVAARRASDERMAAVRIVLSGSTPLAHDLARRPERLRQTVIELAGEIAGDGIWIEKIQNRTLLPADVAANGQANELFQIMQEVIADPDRIRPALKAMVDPLRTKLPESMKELEALQIVEDPERLALAFARIAPRIAERLRNGGDEP
jgi:DNA repair protein SbcD/Mre11